MGDKWKTLDINNIPSDILVGGYEFECYRVVAYAGLKDNEHEWLKDNSKDIADILSKAQLGFTPYRYRTPEPLPPTHEALANEYYDKICEREGVSHSGNLVLLCIEKDIKEAFVAGRESADIPPEAV